ncbi:MAG: PKD domain-containing protein [Lewinellaceae bacterium]|nr:PKD domain-containing protein [Lewinellaceae bacterium]
MKKHLLLVLFAVCCTVLYSQKNDYFWIFGYEGGNQSPPDDEFGNAILDFGAGNRPELEIHQEYDMNFSATCATICDSTGQLQFYTNGEKVYNRHHVLMENGQNINTNEDGYGYKSPQGAISMPMPGKPGKYALFHFMDKIFPVTGVAGQEMYFNEIDMTQNNNLGKIVQKRVILVKDSLSWGKITAVKHANGRDWWVLMGTSRTEKIYEVLLTPDGAEVSDTLVTDTICHDGLGQAAFSPDGTKYIRTNDVILGEPFRVDVYDFDRCTGQLSNQRTKFLDYPGFGVGIAVSPDSRYLYVMRTTKAFQYDLTAADIFATETLVAEWDGFISGAVYGSYFRFSQLGPDGRIYAASSPTFHLHQVNFPNRKGVACDFRQHSINLTVYNAYTIPNFPNYRLGPVDGSSCDTLGLDNRPVANFRWEHEDSLDLLQVTFTDLSSYEPAQWYWDFGDGNTAQDTSPVHLFAAEGTYYVCQTVSNANSADTFCQQVTLGLSAVEEAAKDKPRYRAAPNPARDVVEIRCEAPALREQSVIVRNALGVVVATGFFPPGSTSLRINLRGQPEGMLFFTVTAEGQSLYTGKIILQH